MIIDCISDLHGDRPHLKGGDLLIVAGDLTARDFYYEHFEFEKWLCSQKYEKKVVIAGNHDGFLVNSACVMFEDVEYLKDSGFYFRGFKIWGSPWTPTFYNWHFMKDRGAEIKEKWDLIPDDVDILVTHGPPFGILDKVTKNSRPRGVENNVGCEELREAVLRVKPKLHVFGHIHSEGGKQEKIGGTIFVNASIMDESYDPINKPVRIIL